MTCTKPFLKNNSSIRKTKPFLKNNTSIRKTSYIRQKHNIFVQSRFRFAPVALSFVKHNQLHCQLQHNRFFNCLKYTKKTSRRFDLRAFVRRVSVKENIGEHVFCMRTKHVIRVNQWEARLKNKLEYYYYSNLFFND